MTTLSDAPETRSHPRFAVLVTGQGVSSFGDAFATVAMPLLVLRLTGSVGDMGIVAGLSSACQLVGGLVSGPVMDRVDRRLLLLACDGAQALLVGSIPVVWLVVRPGDLSQIGILLIYLIVIVSSILITVYQVAFRSSLPQIVGRASLVRANATLAVATQVAYGIGPAIAGLTVAALGEPQALGLNAATFVVAAVCWYLVRWRKVNATTENEALAVSLSGRLVGVRFLWRDMVLRSLTVLDTVAGLIGAGAMTLFVYYVRVDLGRGSTAVGILLSIGSVGAVGAALVAVRLREHCGFGPAWLIGLGCQGTALTLVALADSLVPVAVLVALFGFGQTLSLVLSLSYRQQRTPDSCLGRVTAASTTLLLMAATVGSVTSTAIASHVPTKDVFVALGVLGLAATCAGCATPLRRRRYSDTGRTYSPEESENNDGIRRQHSHSCGCRECRRAVLDLAGGPRSAPGVAEHRDHRQQIRVSSAHSGDLDGYAAAEPAAPDGRSDRGMLRRARTGNGRALRGVNLVAAVVVSALLLGVLGFGYGAIPALGPALDPGRGAWTAAVGGQAVSSQQLTVPGLSGPVTVSYSAQGLVSISAGSTRDAFLAMGYVEAKFRLAEMDAERRLGEGRLAQLGGPADLASDEFELRLGLLRTARNEWARTTGAARTALLAYAQGVNDDIAQVRAAGDWPSLFTLTGQYPASWTPADSLVVQGVLTQELEYTTGALDESLLTKSLGAATAADYFPAVAANAQTPYDLGPYQKLPLTQVRAGFASSAPSGAATTRAVTNTGNGGVTGEATARSGNWATAAAAVASVLDEISQLKPDQTHQYPDSNAWAANGPAVQGGGAILGGDPHLPQTEPSVWFEVAVSAPGYQVAGVSVPGVPGILIGHNAHIAWSLVNTQNSATFYYQEKVKGTEYYSDGAWHPMTVVPYQIPVRGGATKQLTVDITAQGPIISQHGEQLAVDWMGSVPSDDLGALIGVNTATNFTQFKAALRNWLAPTMNFVYADSSGNIGVIAPGYYPQVPTGCQPWLPMPGTGACDINGVIPYQAVPQSYDPPSHLIAADNQRPVSAHYPYYIGTAMDFDPGYRAAHAYATLKADEPLTPAKVAALQNDLTDPLAQRVLPVIDQALSSAHLSGPDAQAAALLEKWNADMSATSAAASVWWTFWGSYLNQVFAPWWQAAKVPVSEDAGLKITASAFSLDEDLESWTLHDPTNVAFAGPRNDQAGAAQAAIVAAFGKTVAHLEAKLGGAPSTWAWGRLHTREFPSISGAAGLGYGPRAAGGDPFTEDAADGGLNADFGPSWRMIVAFGAAGASGPGATLQAGTPQGTTVNGVYAVGVYPGGQSENPASPWYQNLINAWWDGRYLAMPVPGETAGPTTWTLRG